MNGSSRFPFGHEEPIGSTNVKRNDSWPSTTLSILAVIVTDSEDDPAMKETTPSLGVIVMSFESVEMWSTTTSVN